jgi:iron complex transport system substrate-binding protein
MASPLWQSLPAVQAGNLVPVKHSHAATYETALLALDSIDEALAALPANRQQ